MKAPKRIVRITGNAPLSGTVYKMQRLRCNLCGEIFTADTPEGVGEDKYDAKSKTMIALLKYGTGMPFNRLENLQQSLGIPLPASTRFEIVASSAGDLFMSLIHTCNLAGANPFDYLTTLHEHATELAKHPDRWMPWNYTAAPSQPESS